MHTPYIVPSESGTRGNVRWLALSQEAAAAMPDEYCSSAKAVAGGPCTHAAAGALGCAEAGEGAEGGEGVEGGERGDPMITGGVAPGVLLARGLLTPPTLALALTLTANPNPNPSLSPCPNPNPDPSPQP